MVSNANTKTATKVFMAGLLRSSTAESAKQAGEKTEVSCLNSRRAAPAISLAARYFKQAAPGSKIEFSGIGGLRT
jgi:ABC-type phosphate transport system substrate-binding protein